jgi:uncharacterized protein YecT (DUF1311 family)
MTLKLIAVFATTAALVPPVIHEPFTALPCTGSPANRTTLQMEGCAEQQILTGDLKIDALNKSIFGKLTGATAKRQFIAGHNAWLAYRRTYCQSVSDVFEGGSEQPVLFAQCEASVNSEHIHDLRSFLTDLTSD